MCEATKGRVSEWSNEHDWKSCVRQKRTEGSNPSPSVEPDMRTTCIRLSSFLPKHLAAPKEKEKAPAEVRGQVKGWGIACCQSPECEGGLDLEQVGDGVVVVDVGNGLREEGGDAHGVDVRAVGHGDGVGCEESLDGAVQ